MSHQLSAKDLHFLGAVAWPESGSRSELALYIADATGIDAALLKLLVARPLPSILGSLSRGRALAGAQAIKRVGGDAFVCSLAQVEALGPTLKVKDMELESGALRLPLWRLDEARVPLADITLLVRSTVSASVRRVKDPPRPRRLHSPLGGSMVSYQELQPTIEQSTRTSEKLDIHARDGRVFQIDGDKFGYSILGAGKAQGDKSNMDRMFELLRHFAPAAITDDFFRLWTPPAEIKRFRLPMMKINNDDPAFAFYSRWVALMYRHLGAIT